MSNILKVIDLFCGCGGATLGFQNAGFKILAGFDNWEVAINVYKKNFTHEIVNMDLRSINGDYEIFTKYEPDVIIGGPPCQDFSHAGKRDEELGRADLTLAFAEIVANVKPKFFAMENVDRAIKSKKYKVARNIFKDAGYGLTEIILEANLYNVPQNRKRLFVIGELNGDDDALGELLEKPSSFKPITVGEYFQEILGEKPNFDYYYRHPRTYQRRAIYSINEPSATIRGVNRPVPKSYKLHPNDASPSLNNVKPLTTLQRSYIQTFPKGFIFEGSKTDLEQMIGNAVPVKLAEHVGKCLMNYIENGGYRKQKKPKQLELFISNQVN